MEVSSVIVKLMEPEVETAQIMICAFIGIPMQVAEVLHQHKRRILFLAAERCILRNFAQHGAARFKCGVEPADKILALLFPGRNARVGEEFGHKLPVRFAVEAGVEVIAIGPTLSSQSLVVLQLFLPTRLTHHHALRDCLHFNNEIVAARHSGKRGLVETVEQVTCLLKLN